MKQIESVELTYLIRCKSHRTWFEVPFDDYKQAEQFYKDNINNYDDLQYVLYKQIYQVLKEKWDLR